MAHWAMLLLLSLSTALIAPTDKIIRSRSDLPTLPSNCTLQVYYVERIISAGGVAAEMLQAYHSGVGFDTRSCSPQLPTLLLEWYALDFPYGAVLPYLTGSTGLSWNNTAVVGMVPFNSSDWDKVHLVGSVTGAQFNAWSPWVIQYSHDNPAYQVWDVWSAAEPSEATRFFNDSICTSFSQSALIELWRLGANFTTQEPLQRDYIPLLTHESPRTVDMNNSTAAAGVRAFYSAFSHLAHLQFANRSQFVDELSALVMTGNAYVYDAKRDVYLHVVLSAPYLGLSANDTLYQQMMMPWQRPGPAAVTVEEAA